MRTGICVMLDAALLTLFENNKEIGAIKGGPLMRILFTVYLEMFEFKTKRERGWLTRFN